MRRRKGFEVVKMALVASVRWLPRRRWPWSSRASCCSSDVRPNFRDLEQELRGAKKPQPGCCAAR